MSAKAIYETDGKSLLAKCFQNTCYVQNKFAVIVHDTNWDAIVQENPWIASEVSKDTNNFHIAVKSSFQLKVVHEIKPVLK